MAKPDKTDQGSDKGHKGGKPKDDTPDSGSGGGITYDASTSTYFVDTTVSASELNGLIESADDGSTIVLSDGLHVFDQPIVIERENIALTGESEQNTIIQFSFSAEGATAGISVSGGDKTQIGTSASFITAGDTTLTLSDGHNIQAGDMLYLSQDNTEQYLIDNEWTNVSWDDAQDRPFREAIVEVVSVDGNTITLAQSIPYDMDADLAQVYSIDLLDGISLSNFTITFDEGSPNDHDFNNPLVGYEGFSAVLIDGTHEASLNQISVIDSPSHAFDLRTSLELSADDLYIDGAHNKGPGGNGYGIQLYETFSSTLTNLEIYDVRHAVLFSSWHAEANNTIEVTGTNRDINFHGSPDTGNTVIVENAYLDYDPSQNTGPERGYWEIVGPGGSTHAQIDPYADNQVLFGAAVGYDAGETIYGWDEGAYLNGAGGQDTLIGGAGDDILVGGDNKDVLTGNGGSDTFLFRLGDNYDTITDFDIDADQIVLSGNSDVDSFDDLQIAQDGDNTTVRYGANSTLILEGVQAGSLAAEQFSFDPDGTATAGLYDGSDYFLA